MRKKLLVLMIMSSCLFTSCSRGTVEVPVAQVEISEFDKCIDLVPETVMVTIEKYGYTVELVDSLDDLYNLSYVSGITIPETKQILIENDENKYRQCVIHEIFHAYDDSLGFISETDEFLAIYEEEKDLLEVTGYITAGQYKANSKEYFAEACQQYVYDAESVKNSAPKTYGFVKGVIEN